MTTRTRPPQARPKPAEKTAEKPAERKGRTPRGAAEQPCQGRPSDGRPALAHPGKMDEIRERREKREAARQRPACRRLAGWRPRPSLRPTATRKKAVMPVVVGTEAALVVHRRGRSRELGPDQARSSPPAAQASASRPSTSGKASRVDLEAIKFDYRLADSWSPQQRAHDPGELACRQPAVGD